MKHKSRIVVAITSLALAALACQALTGQSDPPATDVVIDNTSEPISTAVPLATPTEDVGFFGGPDVLMEDDFTEGRSEWGTGTDADSSVEYVDDALNIQIFTGNYVVWTYPNETDYQNVHMEVTVHNNGSDSDAAFGVYCYKQYPIDDNRYYFAVTPSGEYAIAKGALAVDDEILTNNNTWDTSDLIAKDAASYRLGADCGNGTLSLYVDGQLIDSVSDSTYTSGGISLFAWSSEQVGTVNFSFDDFIMTELQ